MGRSISPGGGKRGRGAGSGGPTPFSSKRLKAIFLSAALLLTLPLGAERLCGAEEPGGSAPAPEKAVSLKFSLAGALFVDVAPYGVERWLPAVYSKLGLEVRERFAFSLRPAFLYENSTLGLRVPLSVDLIFPMSKEKGHTISPYAGGGFALYDDGGYAFRPMVAGGVDLEFGGRFLVALGGDLLFKEADTDLELFMGLGYVFGKRVR